MLHAIEPPQPPFPPPEPPLPPDPPFPRPTPDQSRHARYACAISIILAALIGVAATQILAQGGPGIVITVSEQGMATVRIGEKEQTVLLPEAKVGDKVVCTVKDEKGTWECTVLK